MGKTRTLEDKIKIVKEFKKGASIHYLNRKYDIPGTGIISIWNNKTQETY